MDEQNNGPVPGIIGQDAPSAPVESAPVATEPQDNGKIFDSSEFTGTSQESLSFNSNGEAKTNEKKAKGPNPFTKWQTWAIASGVILVAAIAAIFITVAIYDGKLANANAIARYDSLSSSLDNYKEEFEKNITAYTKKVYGATVYANSLTVYESHETDPEKYIYPTENDIRIAGKNCLKLEAYGLTDEDLAYVDSRKTGAELSSEGKNVTEEAERLEKINNAYRSASSAIDTCHDSLLDVKLSDFEITLGDLEITEKDKSIDVKRKIKITYKGKKELKSLSLFYGMIDKNGLVTDYHFVNHTSGDGTIKTGDTFESRICGYTYSTYTSTDRCVYTVSADKRSSLEALKPKLLIIRGSYK